MRQYFCQKVPLCTSLVSHNFVWGTLYCSCMHFYASSSHSIMSLSIKMQGNIKTSGICLWDPLKNASYTIQILCSINLSTILSKKQNFILCHSNFIFLKQRHTQSSKSENYHNPFDIFDTKIGYIKAYVSEEILNWHCLSHSLNADLCIHVID